MANAEKIREVLDYITKHPEEWDQSIYARRTECGSAYCVAGLAVVLNGHQLHWSRHEHLLEDLRKGIARHSFNAVRNGHEFDVVSIPWLAQEELELSDNEAYQFFKPHNTIDRLWQLAGQFTDGEVKRSQQW